MKPQVHVPTIHSVLKEWVFTLPYRMQSVLMSAVRGCDTAPKDDASKFVSRAIRGLILNNADPTNTFIVGDGTVADEHRKKFLWDMDAYPMHFIAHTMHAAEIVGYKYVALAGDDKHAGKIRNWWQVFYFDMVKGLHLNPEREEQLDVRLGYTPAEKEELAKDPTWDAGTGTSHGGRNRAWSGGS